MNSISSISTTKPNNSSLSSASGTQTQQPIKTTEPQQDTFTSKKIAGHTIGGVFAGGIIGVLKEKIMPKKFSQETIEKYTTSKFGKLDEIASNKTNAILDQDMHLLQSAARKMIDGTELTQEETKFLNSSRLVLPEDAKFFMSDESPFKQFLQQITLFDTSDSSKCLSQYNIHVNTSGLTGGAGTWINIKDRIEDFLQSGGKYSDNEDFLDYINTRIYGDDTFRIATDKNGKINYITSKIRAGEGFSLSDKTYTYKEIVEHAKKQGVTNFSDVMIASTKESPGEEYYRNIVKQAEQEAENELKQQSKAAINKLHHKQLLKSAGIGALVIGALVLAGNLIYKKANKNEQSDKSV